METIVRRRLFTEKEDFMLLRHINAERPFEASKGDLIKAWGRLATKLASHEEFSRPFGITGRSIYEAAHSSKYTRR
ncbi:hypothetical protein Ae201684P_014725 [Aphanomyces euteiches]|uniref:Uncharacterized protein n=1 Tax=Aphanomyces euteiches TaxID=100861 RepID=A0A6G0WXJ2_9STRA|nr:hypothetical protein Ae201684_010588 [Aphanomyces euteiches]KAH9089970.1 hypothetical protein Ae201684P_014725 [Aphanomyces euteiches]